MRGQPDSKEWIISIIQNFEGPLLRYAITFTKDLEKARDIVQDCFVRLCKQNTAKIKPYIAPWLFKVCRNRALEILRKDNKIIPLKEGQLENYQTNVPDPALQNEKKELKQNIFRILETLSRNQQEVIRLKFQNGLSYQEISQITQLSVSNIGFLLHTGLKKISQVIKKEGKQNIGIERRVL